MRNPYQGWLNALARAHARGAALPLGGLRAPRPVRTDAAAGVAMIFSPHPDDECIVGGLALRLLREGRMRVVNVAVTLGSRRDRQAARWQELSNACAYLGFDLVGTGPSGLEHVSAGTRASDPAAWSAKVAIIAGLLRAHGPRVVFVPHEADWNGTHIGVHHLVMDALRSLPDLACTVVETEFWGAMAAPNLMVEIGARDLADLIAALSFHAGEVQRNPYHLRLPAWMQDNVRRGAEVVGGQGRAAPDFPFATLYRIGRWAGGRLAPAAAARMLSARESACTVLEA